MKKRAYFILFLLGFAMMFVVLHFRPGSGYMDSDYYYANALHIAEGKPLEEPFLWNYLDSPEKLPHPAFAYWMPLSSFIAALGIWLSGHATYFAARIPFFVLAALVPPLTAALSYRITSRRDFAWVAGGLAVLSEYYAPFLSAVDAVAIYMLLGGAFFLLLTFRRDAWKSFLLGVLVGLMHLSRADGAVWGIVAVAAIFWQTREDSAGWREFLKRFFLLLFPLAAGYVLVVAPWFYRNWRIFGTILSPAGSRALWLTSYNETFVYPPEKLTFAYWFASGWKEILGKRLWALGVNLETALGVQGGIVLFPLILLAVWELRRDIRVRVGIFAWALTLFIMTVVFPFAGTHGSFLHSGSALQPLWWAIAPLGLDKIVVWAARRRRWRIPQARIAFQGELLFVAALLTWVILAGALGSLTARRVFWGDTEVLYRNVESFLVARDALPEEVVIVSNPPAYYTATGRSAIVVPDGDVDTVLAVARRYHASYLILEKSSLPRGIKPIFDSPESFPSLRYLGDVNETTRVFYILDP